MKMKYLLILLMLLMTCSVASAENVSVEIYQNSAGEYFLTINEGELQSCGNGFCTVNIDNVSSTDTVLSTSDMRYIAQYTAIELGTFEQPDFSEFEGVNETAVRSILNDIIEDTQAADRAWIEKTWMPAVLQYQNCTLELQEKKGALDTLDAKFAGYDAQIEAKDSTIETLKKNNDLYWTLIILLSGTIFIILVGKTDAIRSVREWRER